MRTAHPLRCLRRCHFVLARRGHGGTAQMQRELKRLALLEEFMTQPAETRAQQAPATTAACTAAYLRELPQRVEQMRGIAATANGDQALPEHGVAGTSASATLLTEHEESRRPSGEVSAPQVSTLSQFLSACKKHRVRYSSSADPALRKQGRDVFRSFWSRHASSAVACCYESVRDLGFVADIGLADTGLHLGMRDMRGMLRVLQTNHAAASSLDTTRVLGYLARELQYWESRKDSESDGSTAPAPVSLMAFRAALTDVALGRLASIFVQQRHCAESFTRPRVKAAANVPASDDSVFPPAQASGADAVWGLEALSVLHARDATEGVLEDVWTGKQLCLLRQQREPAHLRSTPAFPDVPSATVPMSALATEVQHLLVSELFRVVAARRRDLRMTDIVHAYALLRVHLRLLWPPYGRQPPPQPSRAARHHSRGCASVERDRSHAASTSAPATAQRRPLWYEKDTLFRVTWGLAVALASKDRVFISGYHFVKIVAVLAKLPAFVLSQEPHVKTELRRFELPHRGVAFRRDAAEDDAESRFVCATIAAEVIRQEMAVEAGSKPPTAVALHPSDFWRFIVAKACVFVPSLPPEQRRIVCRSLHLAITEKRAHLLPLHASATARSAPVLQSARRVRSDSIGRQFGSRTVSPDGSGAASASEILRPLVEEMEDYPEPYEACIKDHRPRSPPPRVAPRRRPQWQR
ncbi:conserved hypothetical protein [Leishmania infantum JPCM5]|uniref:Uncharacterized protein n=2 Tax=Leishmania infantum TaxID=5671 RepID=A4I5J1_LEIIN|nr:conserved hypothetical protein [Leishmania infantum JPCM5]CAC9513615.1 hypothetical_protein_-_conserved [Leishmania infantum]CAM70061.1 conserved hypothetical protein [Leishmania infantum JPCM5]SUZ43979.1 hypothetical_protein_-_conserved [Leishmania infantum]|eukprot:XP_001467010.1 conserved hypothetical protein [Leishmania infantum JPCM5]